MLALVWATRHFRPYLYGRRFTLRTDHNCLRWLHNFKEPEGRVAQWLELLSEFDYRVVHRPGAQHLNADSLSHKPCTQCGMPPDTFTWTTDEMREMQDADCDLQQIIRWVESQSFPNQLPKQATPHVQTLWNQRTQLVLKSGILIESTRMFLVVDCTPSFSLFCLHLVLQKF